MRHARRSLAAIAWRARWPATAEAARRYAAVASVLLQKPEDTLARIAEEAARDRLYRVTITEAGGAAVLSVSRTVQVDVLDFP